MRTLALVAAAVLGIGTATAQGKKDPDPAPAPAPAAAPPSTEMQVYGPGTISCATYLNDRTIRINADGWILGFWTGSNRVNQDTHTVGHSTDSRGIVGEVALNCRTRPSTTIFAIEKEIYDRMKGENR